MDGRDKQGGAVVLTKNNIVTRPAWHVNLVGGSAQAVWLGGRLFVSILLAPTFESHEVFEETVSKLSSLPKNSEWLMGGLQRHSLRMSF